MRPSLRKWIRPPRSGGLFLGGTRAFRHVRHVDANQRQKIPRPCRISVRVLGDRDSVNYDKRQTVSLQYDFDVHVVVDDEQFGSDAARRESPDFGLSFQAKGTKVAMFRDPKTAAALRSAPIGVRNLFIEAGFGMNSHCSGVPEGFFPAGDRTVRQEMLTRLRASLDEEVPQDHDQGVFCLIEFLEAVSEAKPISDEALTTYHRAVRRKADALLDFDRTMFLTKVMGIVILAFITSRFTMQF